METYLIAITTISVVMTVSWLVLYKRILPTELSGDTWYMRRFAYQTRCVSAPYCFRPLLPMMARYVGFHAVSYPAIALTPIVAYWYVGGGATGLAIGLMYLGNCHMAAFNAKNPEYAEGLGHLLMVSSLWAISVESLWAIPLVMLSCLCRETIGAALFVVAAFTAPWLCVPIVLTFLCVWLLAREDKDNTHPLIEKTYVGTVTRWLRNKGENGRHYAVTIQPLRWAPFAVPFVWERVGDFARLGLLGLLPIWVLSLPASGQSRVTTYGFWLFVPFLAALEPAWLWCFCAAQWFWPADFRVFEENGDRKFGFAK